MPARFAQVNFPDRNIHFTNPVIFHPLVLIALALGLGVVIAQPLTFPFLFLQVGLLLTLIGLVLLKDSKPRNAIFIFCLALAVSLFYADARSQRCLILRGIANQLVDATDHHIVGRIAREPSQSVDRTAFLIETQSIDQKPIKMLIKLSTVKNEVQTYGDVVVTDGKFLPSTPTTVPGAFDPEGYDKSKGISGHVRAEHLTLVDRSIGYAPLRAAIHLKAGSLQRMSRWIPAPYDSLLGGLLLGTASSPLPDDWNDIYRRAGVTHILVVSGSQVALLVGTLVMIISALGLSPGIQFTLCSLANILFVLLTGADPSIVRAGVMAQISLFAVWSGRISNVALTLAFTWITMLLYQPLYLFQAGFQLSFAATAALLWVAPVVRNRLQKRFPRLPEFVADALALAIGPTITTLPLGMVLFHAVSTVTIISNLTIAPLIEVLVLAGAAGLGLAWLPGPLGGFFLRGLYALMGVMHHWLSWLAALPLSYIYIVSPTWWLLIAYYAGLVYYCARANPPQPKNTQASPHA